MTNGHHYYNLAQLFLSKAWWFCFGAAVVTPGSSWWFVSLIVVSAEFGVFLSFPQFRRDDS